MGENSGSVTPQPESDSSGSSRPGKPGKKDWELTPEAFESLLLWLNPDRDRAGERYERIRERLIRFFTIGNGLSPEDLADRTINIVAGKLIENEKVRSYQCESYCYGVAKNVLKESFHDPEWKSIEIELLPPSHQPTVTPDKTQEEKEQEEKDAQYQELCDKYMQLCLDGLELEERELISEYHSGGDKEGDNKWRRKEIAKRLGINTKALTKKAGRIRKRLEDCVAKRFAESNRGKSANSPLMI